MSFPKMAYVLLWFPCPSETFIFREVMQLRALGMPIDVYTLYGKVRQGCSQEMHDYDGAVTRLGIPASWRIIRAFWREACRNPRQTWGLMREGLLRKMRSFETFLENSLCFFGGFYLAELVRQDAIALLHSPWGNGPGTAVWIASRLTGVPFVLTGRAGDIYPPDGVLREKLRDATLVRTNNGVSVRYLGDQCPAGQQGKVRLVYNSLTLRKRAEARVGMQPPCTLLAVGRFVRTKGFDILLTALARLKREGLDVRLTLVGDGWLRWSLRAMVKRLQLQDIVTMPGFVPHDQLLQYMQESDMLIMPSVIVKNGDRDGIPNVIMEALSNRLPVIATDVSGISEVVRNGETGLLIEQRDPRALAGAIKYMIGHREQALTMAAQGRALVEKLFDHTANIASLRDLYCEAYAMQNITAMGKNDTTVDKNAVGTTENKAETVENAGETAENAIVRTEHTTAAGGRDACTSWKSDAAASPVHSSCTAGTRAASTTEGGTTAVADTMDCAPTFPPTGTTASTAATGGTTVTMGAGSGEGRRS